MSLEAYLKSEVHNKPTTWMRNRPRTIQISGVVFSLASLRLKSNSIIQLPMIINWPMLMRILDHPKPQRIVAKPSKYKCLWFSHIAIGWSGFKKMFSKPKWCYLFGTNVPARISLYCFLFFNNCNASLTSGSLFSDCSILPSWK